jgi:LysR family glycine cleavage system transcriptional activator
MVVVPLSRTFMPSVQELIAFEAAARHGSFTKAAAELALTQSAVSKQIRQLEATLDVALFSRANGRAALTLLGEQYIRTVRKILSDYETSTYAMIAAGGSETTLKIAVLPTFGSRWLIPRLPGFLAKHPGVTLHMVSELQPFDLAEKAVDVAIHYGDANWPLAESAFLFDEAIVAVASPAYLADHGLRQAKDLSRATLLQQATRANLWQTWFDAAGVEHPFPYRGPIFDQFSMTSQAAAAGMGVGLVPAFLIERELESGALATLGEPLLPGSGAYHVVTPLRMQRSAVVTSFVDWILGEAGRSRATSVAWSMGGPAGGARAGGA